MKLLRIGALTRNLCSGSDGATSNGWFAKRDSRCIVSVPGHWNDTQLLARNFFVPGTELGGFTVTVSGIACAIHNVGPDRLVFWMPVDAPLGDYSAIVNTPTGMRSVAMHVVKLLQRFTQTQME